MSTILRTNKAANNFKSVMPKGLGPADQPRLPHGFFLEEGTIYEGSEERGLYDEMIQEHENRSVLKHFKQDFVQSQKRVQTVDHHNFGKRKNSPMMRGPNTAEI